MKSSFIISFMALVLISSNSYASAKVYLGTFDFDYECKAAANKAGFQKFEFSPLNGTCYGIK